MTDRGAGMPTTGPATHVGACARGKMQRLSAAPQCPLDPSAACGLVDSGLQAPHAAQRQWKVFGPSPTLQSTGRAYTLMLPILPMSRPVVSSRNALQLTSM